MNKKDKDKIENNEGVEDIFRQVLNIFNNLEPKKGEEKMNGKYMPDRMQKEMDERNWFEATKSGDVEKLKKLIEKGVDINLRGTLEETALIAATYWRKNEVVKFLIKFGADLSLNQYNKKTALDIAKFYKNDELVKILEKAEYDKLQSYIL